MGLSVGLGAVISSHYRESNIDSMIVQPLAKSPYRMDIMIEKTKGRRLSVANPVHRRILLKYRTYCENINWIYLTQDGEKCDFMNTTINLGGSRSYRLFL